MIGLWFRTCRIAYGAAHRPWSPSVPPRGGPERWGAGDQRDERSEALGARKAPSLSGGSWETGRGGDRGARGDDTWLRGVPELDFCFFQVSDREVLDRDMLDLWRLEPGALWA